VADKRKWMQAVSEQIKAKGTKGAFRRWCKARGHKKVTETCIREAIRVAKRTGNKRLLRRAILARTFLRASKGGKKS